MSEFDPPLANQDEFVPTMPEPGMMRRRDNVMAVASLVSGVLCCGLGATSLLAIIFGVIGLRRTRDGSTGGRGMAAAGMSLGLLGLLFWIPACIGPVQFVPWYMRESEQVQKTTETFVQDVVEGRFDDAMKHVQSDVERKKLETVAEKMKAFGPFSHINVEYAPVKGPPSLLYEIRFRWLVDGTVFFSRGSGTLSMSLLKDGDEYKVERFDLK